ncbi:MAG: hypothetical protein HN509_10360 [Halobacteriovoraceae bacterium]|jgi:peptidyl-prolyl cis-trans isomerase SurA|nr:hypothetical protein [Halobacteriovoraceae bacterium]
MLFKAILFSALFSISFNLKARLLDKIFAVIDDKVITMSQVRRMKTNLPARRSISPLIYKKKNYKNSQMISLMVQRLLIRDRLSEMGYTIGDDQVEAQIKSTETKLGLNRKALLEFLRSNSTTFDEYFEMIRESIEFNIFNERVIRPLISITEQEIKNTFFKENFKKNTRMNFRYTLVDFSINKKFMKKGMKNRFTRILKSFQVNGTLPEAYSSMNTNTLGDITEDGLSSQLKNLLKKTSEGSFTLPTLLGNDYHVFFVKKKDLVESTAYRKSKGRIRRDLYIQSAGKISSLWYQREEGKHYIKYFF